MPGAFLTSRPSPTHTAHFVHVLLVLHAYTGLFTVASALQHNDNEGKKQTRLYLFAVYEIFALVSSNYPVIGGFNSCGQTVRFPFCRQ